MKARFWLAQKEAFDHGSDPLSPPAPLGVVALVLGMVVFWTVVAFSIHSVVF